MSLSIDCSIMINVSTLRYDTLLFLIEFSQTFLIACIKVGSIKNNKEKKKKTMKANIYRSRRQTTLIVDDVFSNVIITECHQKYFSSGYFFFFFLLCLNRSRNIVKRGKKVQSLSSLRTLLKRTFPTPIRYVVLHRSPCNNVHGVFSFYGVLNTNGTFTYHIYN